MSKGYVSDEVRATRVVSHGQITDLTSAFSLPNGEPFTIFLVPKASASADSYIILNVKGWQDDSASAMPIIVADWNPILLSEISGSQASILNNYDIYWGCGY